MVDPLLFLSIAFGNKIKREDSIAFRYYALLLRRIRGCMSNAIFTTAKQRIAAREDSEFFHVALRIVMVLFMSGYFLSPYFRGHVDAKLVSQIYILLASIFVPVCGFLPQQ